MFFIHSNLAINKENHQYRILTGSHQTDEYLGINTYYSHFYYHLDSIKFLSSVHYLHYKDFYGNFGLFQGVYYEFGRSFMLGTGPLVQRNSYYFQDEIPGSWEGGALLSVDFVLWEYSRLGCISFQENLAYLKRHISNYLSGKEYFVSSFHTLSVTYRNNMLSFSGYLLNTENYFNISYEYNFNKNIKLGLEYNHYLESVAFSFTFRRSLFGFSFQRYSLEGNGRNAVELMLFKNPGNGNKSESSKENTLESINVGETDSELDEDKNRKSSKNTKTRKHVKSVDGSKSQKSPYRFLSFNLLLKWGLTPANALKLAQLKNEQEKFENFLFRMSRKQFDLISANLQRIYTKKNK
jgi:hypothetical protein